MAAVFCILGHIFPAVMGFNGGKGLACIGGGLLAYDKKLFAIIFAIEVILALVTDYICVVPISAAVVIPMLYAYNSGDLIVLIFMCITSVVIICKHMENLRRIFRGMEVRISYLWNREEEVNRVKENTEKNAEC